MANRYTKALKQLKSKSIDEKLELLSEIPTNSSGGLYVDVPGVYTTPPITSPIGVTGTPVDLDQDGDVFPQNPQVGKPEFRDAFARLELGLYKVGDSDREADHLVEEVAFLLQRVDEAPDEPAGHVVRIEVHHLVRLK